MREATIKQIAFANAISQSLNISLPGTVTRQSLFLFIRDNKPKFYEKAKCKREKASYISTPSRFLDDEWMDSNYEDDYGLVEPHTHGVADD